MKIRRFNENSTEERQYMETAYNVCPVCGEENNLKIWSSTIDSIGIDGDFDDFFLDYECRNCEFKWYSKFALEGQYDTNTGKEIVTGEPIDPSSYNSVKLFTKKYNI